MRRTLASALVVLCLGTIAPAAAASQVKLIASDAGFDFFGTSVATTGTTTVVGSPEDTRGTITNAGAAYVYTSTGGTWSQQAKLIASDAGVTDFFGLSVGISGDTAVVGSYRDDNAKGVNAGSAYVFTRTGTVWTQQAKLIAGDGAAEDRFGMSVAIAGDTILVGAPQDDGTAGADAGSVYVFTRSGVVWAQQAKLTASDHAAFDRFGISVALASDTAVVGSYLDDHGAAADAGSAYVFTRTGTAWSQQAKLAAGDPGASDWFGVSVAVSGDSALVGAYGDDNGSFNVGAAYVFTRTGTSWPQQAKLTPFDAADADLFGISVAIAGTTAIVGAGRDDHSGVTDAGSAYAYVRAENSWTLQRKLLAADAGDRDSFGFSVALAGGVAVAGVPNDDHSDIVDAGSAYVFDGFTSQNAPPDTTIVSGPPAVTGPSASFSFTGVDDLTPSAHLTFVCSLDGAAFTACSSPAAYSNLASGAHEFRVAARDAEGNVDPSPAARSWTVDVTGPTTTFITANNTVLLNLAGIAPTQVTGRANDDAAGVAEVLVTFTPIDLGSASTVAASLSCGVPTSCVWSTPPPEGLGRWEIRARARDALGNVGPTAGPITVIVIGLP